MKGWIKPFGRSTAIALILVASLILQACGGSFASQLRVILAASGPLIESLPLSDAIKHGLVVDFTDLASGAANLKESIDACSDKACKLIAVDTYERLFEAVEARGHFGAHSKLQTVEKILRGIIQSARIYYGAAPSVSTQASDARAKSIDAQLKDLKEAMRP